MAKWRIVRDRWSGYEVQRKVRWWPFWHQPVTNTHMSQEAAETWARRQAKNTGVVANLGEL